MAEVRTHLKRARIDQPDFDPADFAEGTSKPRQHGIGETKRREVRFLIWQASRTRRWRAAPVCRAARWVASGRECSRRSYLSGPTHG